jgi:hypothetical protein
MNREYRIATIKDRIRNYQHCVFYWKDSSPQQQRVEGIPKLKRNLRDNVRKLKALEAAE